MEDLRVNVVILEMPWRNIIKINAKYNGDSFLASIWL